MKRKLRFVTMTVCVVMLISAIASQAQTTTSNTSPNTATVPRLIRYAGVARDENGKALTGMTGITFSLYAEQGGGAALWMETQNVQADSSGHYSVLLGSTKPDGLPAELFASERARWIGVQIEQQAEQARTLLVSAPYALKAGDAETLGGLPPSAFVLAAPVISGNDAPSSKALLGANGSPNSPNSASDVTTTGGKANTIPLFTTATNIQNSILTQTGTTAVNVGGNLNLPATGTATTAKGFDSQAHDFVASVYSSASKAAVAQTFQLQAEPVGNDTATASGTLNLLYGSGTATPAETGLKISNKGVITFATGQTFPGTGNGTITGVTAGTGLSGGGTSGTVTLKNAGVLSLAAGTGITSSGGQTPTVAINTAVVPQLNAANTFTANQSVNGNLAATGEVAAGGAPSGNVASGDVEVDASALNKGAYGPGLTFAGGGETIASNRNSGTNQFGLDFYTNYTARMSVTNEGLVGIGTRTPGAWLEVDSQSTSYSGLTASGGSSPNGAGQTGSTGLTANGGNGDLSTDANSNAGDGLVANGGASTSLSGNGIIANGGYGQDTGEGGYGLVASGGGGQPDGVGGSFGGGDFDSGGDGIDAFAGSGNAGSFVGDVSISGNLSKGGGSFKIDHPLDPANKYLYHSFVESPDMKNIYDGVAMLDANGEAVIQMPDWFSALNRDFRYQLTPIGAPGPNLYIAEELVEGRFKIAGGQPGAKVSWQITGIRQDAWANAHRIPVEEEKETQLKGYYLHPELYGAPAEKQIEWARHPRMMKRMQQQRRTINEKRARLADAKR